MPSIVGQQRVAGSIRTRVDRSGRLLIEQDFHFRIRADTLEQDRYTILHTTPGVPLYGTPYGSYGMMLRGADAERREDDHYLWDAVYSLSNEVVEGENTDPSSGLPQSGLPTEWLAVVTLGFEDNFEVFNESLTLEDDEKHPDIGGTDADGYNARRWLTSAGEPYEIGFQRQRRIITRDFTQFEPITGSSRVTLDDIEARNDTLNDREFLGKPKRTLKLTVEGCAAGFYYGLRCWRIDYRLHYKKSDWRLKMADVGTFYLSGTNKISLDDDPEFRGALDGSGAKAADQLEPAMRYHKEFESVDMSQFLRLASS